MSPLAVKIGAGALALLALIALRGKRWAYFAFVLLGLAYFPAQAHFHVHAPKCDQVLPALQQLVPLLHGYAYIALFAGFYWMSWVQLRDANARSFWALVVTLLAAALFEIAEGMTAAVAVAKTVRHAKPVAVAVQTHCRVQDLVPAIAGALAAALLLAIWARLTRKPAYVRLVKRGAATAPRAAAQPPRTFVPPRGAVPSQGYSPPILYEPPSPLPPPDFSPGATTVTQPSESAPTEEVAASGGGGGGGGGRVAAARTEVVRRLQTIGGYVRRMLQPIWAIIRGRRAIVGFVLGMLLVGAGAIVLISRLSAPEPVVTAQAPPPPPEPPPPPPRPLQSEVEGYYVPNYKFTVSDRRFTRLTLRPEPSITFARTGTKQDVGCADARIGEMAVFLRCELESAGLTVTIDGRFASRYATNRLDMPALNALITVTNTRGEVLYRARDGLEWHVPD